MMQKIGMILAHGLLCFGLYEFLNVLGLVYRLQVLGGLAQ